jgi:hypothetical protein
VDAAGVIQHAEILENAGEMPNLDEIKAVLSTLN